MYSVFIFFNLKNMASKEEKKQKQNNTHNKTKQFCWNIQPQLELILRFLLAKLL